MESELIKVKTADNLALELRRISGGDKLPVICIPGLTRNRRDFDEFGEWVATLGRDVFAISLRGRGASERDPNYLNYHPLTYRDDILHVMNSLGLDRAVFAGTSLGGIVTMLTNETAPGRVAAAIINDVGPELAPEGIARIASYVGVNRPDARSIEEAAELIKAVNYVAFPGREMDFWRDFAHKTFRETSDGRWVLDYDQAIGKAMVEVGPAPDLWPAFASLADTPTLIVRGAISDLLTPPIIDKMRAAAPDIVVCEVPETGHAPTLREDVVKAAVKEFLNGLD